MTLSTAFIIACFPAPGSCKARARDPIGAGLALSAYLTQNKNLFFSLRVLHLMVESQWRLAFDDSFTESSTQLSTLHHDTIAGILMSVLSSRSVDAPLALGLMFALPMEIGFKCIKSSLGITSADSSLVIKIANVAIVAATVWGQRGFQVQCRAHATNAKWFHQFRLLDIGYDERAFSAGKSGEYQRTLVAPLLSKSSLDLYAALEFARNYNIEGFFFLIRDDFVLFEYVKMLLLNAEIQGYQNKIVGICKDIANQDKLLAIFQDLYLHRISPYDYERIRFVIGQVLEIEPSQEFAKKRLATLEILWNYERCNAPRLPELKSAKERCIGILMQ